MRDIVKITLALVVLAVVVFLGVTFPKGNTIVERIVEKAGGVGQNESFRKFFLEGQTSGGGVYATTTTVATETLTAQILEKNKVIRFLGSATAAAITVTLPASSTLSNVLPKPGDTAEWIIENGYTGAATTTTIAAGTGIDLQEPDGQNVVIGINNYAYLTCHREISTDVVCRVDETIPAD